LPTAAPRRHRFEQRRNLPMPHFLDGRHLPDASLACTWASTEPVTLARVWMAPHMRRSSIGPLIRFRARSARCPPHHLPVPSTTLAGSVCPCNGAYQLAQFCTQAEQHLATPAR
jgi:hypothetical protein